MTLAEAAKLLTLTLPTSYDTVMAAFRGQVRRHHPDTRTMTVDMGGQKSMDDLKQARDVLVKHTRGFKDACAVCFDTGVVRARGFKPVSCPKGCKVKPLTRQPARRKS